MKRAAALFALSGCSFAVMRDPPAQYVAKPECTTSLAVPTIDLVAGIAAALGALLFLGASTDASDGSDDVELAAGFGAGAAISTVSGVLGLDKADRCSVAQRDWADGPIGPPPLARPFVEPVPAMDPRAAQLTRAAHEAASRHRCGPARAVAMSVETLDPVYYERVFLADPTIGYCRW